MIILPKQTRHLIGSMTMASFLWSPLGLAADVIPIGDLPSAVRATLDARYPGATYLLAEHDTDNGQMEYEVTICHNDRKLEIELTPEGQITDIDDDGPC